MQVPPAPLLTPLARLVAVCLLTAAGASAGEQRVEAELSGGTRLWLESRPEATRGELVLVWRAGWLEDDFDSAAAARALAPCTAELDADALRAEAASRGAPFKFEVGPDLAVLRAGGDPDALLWLFERACEWLETAPYPEVVDVPAPVASPAARLRRDFAPALWPAESPLARKAPHGRVSGAACVDQHRARLGTDTLGIGLRGPYGGAGLVERLSERLSSVPRATAPAAVRGGEPRTPAGIEPWIAPTEGARAEIALVWPGPAPSDPREPAATLWRYVVGGERLDAAVRPFDGRVTLERGSDARADRAEPFVLAVNVPAERGGEALRALFGELDRALGDEPPTAEELASYLNEARALLQGLERLPGGGPLDLAVRHGMLGLDAGRFETRLAALVATSAADVAAAGRAFAASRDVVVALAGPGAMMLEAARGLALGEEDAPALEARWLGVPPSDADGAARAERLLAALGGREAWTGLAGLDSSTILVMETAGRRVALESRHLRAFDHLRLRVETQLGGRRSATVLDAAGGLRSPVGWRQTDDVVERLDAATVAAMIDGERRALVRLVARLARGELAATAAPDGPLVLADELGEIVRLDLDEAGRPTRATWDEGGASVTIDYEQWAASGDLQYADRYTISGTPPRAYEVLRSRTDPELPPDTFRAPR